MNITQLKGSQELVPNDISDMLKDFGIEQQIDESLSIGQRKALELFKKGENIAIISLAGTGKSFCLKTLEEYNNLNIHKKMYVTSTTGISAYNIGGCTIHSLMGIGSGDNPLDQLIKSIRRKKIYKERIELMDILVIDEISMLSADIFEKLNAICQNIRGDRRFFGGIQIIFTGDLNQLLCVFNKNQKIYKEIDTRLIIESPIFNKTFVKNKNIIVLKENFRQKGNPDFINLLSRIRVGTFTEQDIKTLETRKNLDYSKINAVTIVSSNRKAQLINDQNLKNIKNEAYSYKAHYIGSGSNKELVDILIKELEYQLKTKGIHESILKKGTRVMLVKNLDVSQGLVNGAVGTIIDIRLTIDGKFPVVKFDNSNLEELIVPVAWEIEIDKCKATATQVPLMIAYSLTVHKLQGCTLDLAIMDLEDAFCDHMVYVALSRVRSLEGIYLKTFNPKKITINKITNDYLKNLED